MSNQRQIGSGNAEEGARRAPRGTRAIAKPVQSEEDREAERLAAERKEQREEALARVLCEANGQLPDDFYMGSARWTHFLIEAREHLTAEAFFRREREAEQAEQAGE